MTKEDVRITLSSPTGKNVYIDAMVSRTLARKIETMLEENHVTILSPYREKESNATNEHQPV